MISLKFPNNEVREFPENITALEVAKTLSPRLAKEALCASINGKLIDLSQKISESGEFRLYTFEDDEGKDVFRHSSAHLMAQAVKRLFPKTKLAIGPAIKDGFYYDFDPEESFSPEDLEKIEAEMEKIVKEDLPIERFVLSRDEAIKFFEEKGEIYKVELVKDIPEGVEISFYRQGEFVDLCTGPHVPSTGYLKAFKLLNIAGAYWRGNEKNKMLQRIYGVSFPKKSMLTDYLNFLEEAKKRDHRKIGQELDLFSLQEEGPGFPFFHPKGMVIRNELENFWREKHRLAGYQEIKTPIILNRELWERSGHWAHYKENMYFTKIDDQDYAIKPMNCPGSILVYKNKLHSYREFPIRLAELGLVHRHELSGVLHGLMRVRCFTQDDAHIFMLPEQVKDEIIGVINLIDEFYRLFGFEYHVELSTRPENSMGSDELWELATNSLKEALEERGLPYKINEGDGAFYGPKIDFHLKDCLGRTWQCGTIQLDFQMPEKFDLTYIGEDGQKHRPVMIHRVVFGSIERFIGILIEHYAGAFPVWLSPVQVRVITVAERHREYGQEIYQKLFNQGVRVELDDRNETIGYKIREGQMQKIPYLLIVGDKEIEQGSVAVRKRGVGDLGQKPFAEFIEELLAEIREKR
ncbi:MULTISPECIES: threonine--tRNA ligase [Carboxydothermus]|uniref:Threonine--tRNA ligase n=2 Tax=Carboxydothermus TaxID=129957 RepID=SYT_CARHZ|nr:RecName: Full=Threonine--tRNA ligase; AltName: Full=Threonyl-tRNA synthetase; Short=ThrRS [Carboxydothermus hydrogenoformans Z-2901]ABB15985.1 threonyl-tRNA synthetase [Carboxydothermus hydrogenoformans Z-2901]NYE58345.1 threonyl-tRNA synthetase [Carboxydothermus ferrireducens DSM 11255]